MRTGIFALALTVVMAAPAVALAHESDSGEPAHMGVLSDGIEQWHDHGPSAEDLEALRAHRQERCEAKQAKMQRMADEWNRREAIAYQELQEACADETPVGQNSCDYRHRMYQANYSPTVAAEFGEWLQGEIAKACAPSFPE